MIPTTIRRTTCSYKDNIFDVHEVEFLQVIEPTMIHDLPQEFNRRLGEILFWSRHIDVITEEYHFLTSLGRAQ